MEPMLPPSDGAFESVAVEFHREAAALAETAHPVTRSALAELVRIINSYYSNLIEGVRTTPAEIEAAMRADYSQDHERAARQRLGLGHVRVDRAITAALAADPAMSVTSAAFLQGLHRDLYADVPDSERVVRAATGRTEVVVPGVWRTMDVTVGWHHPPPHGRVASFMERFDAAYRPDTLPAVRQVVAFAASHHRFAWIHPFLDGNGRVGRLMTTAYARRIGLDAGGLWSIARGFARYRTEYYAALAAADAPRASDVDGRGPLSLAALEAWCAFVVGVSRDQIAYMRSLLALDTLADRLRGYAAYRSASDGAWPAEAAAPLVALLSRGEMPRGEARSMLPGAERTARATLSALLGDGILTSDSHRAPVRLAFPSHVTAFLFPGLVAPAEQPPEHESLRASAAASVRGAAPGRASPSS